MKNKRFLLPLLAMLIVFAMIGCPEDGGDNVETKKITVTFVSHGTLGVVFENIGAEKEALGANRYSKVQALQTRPNFEFKGWSESTAEGSVPVHIDANSVFYNDTIYYALWAAPVTEGDSITIIYVTPDGVANQANKTAKSGEAIGNANLPEITAPNGEYQWLGWSLTIDGPVIGADAVFRSNTTLYGRIQKADVSIKYHLNGYPLKPTSGLGYSSKGTGSQIFESIEAVDEVFYAFPPADKTISYNTAIGSAALPVLTTNSYGYTWLGWSKTRNGAIVSPNEKITVDTTLYARYTFTPKTYTPPQHVDFEMPYDLHPMRQTITKASNDYSAEDWIRGADISNCWEIEQYGGVFKDTEGKIDDIMKILIDNGLNWVRLRLWVEPEKVQNHYPGDGNTSMAVIKTIAARAKAAGLKFLLAYHYSDYWADPQQQYTPVSFKSTNLNDMYVEFANYHRDTINELIAAGAKPDMVSLGNEIRTGFMKTTRPTLGQYAAAGAPANQARFTTWTHWATALQAASAVVRSIDLGIDILIQFDNGGNSDIVDTFGNFTNRVSGAAASSGVNVDYDTIGLSWYTYWGSHGTLDGLYSNISTLKSRYGKKVIVCESGFAFNFGPEDDVDYPPSAWKVNLPINYQDNLVNVYGVKNTGMDTQGATRMTNGNGFIVNSGIPFPHPNGRFAGNLENQARGYRAFMDAVAAAGGGGVMWWGADFIGPVMGLNSNVENSCLWDTNAVAVPAIKVLGGLKGANEAKPGKITGVTVTANSIAWHQVHTSIASKYQIETAASPSGPWTMLTDSQTTSPYTHSGADGTNYYRVRGYNNNGWGNWSEVQ